MATGASVHRRGRCIGVLFSQVYVLSLVLSVLVCLSVDVTGALVLPNSFCVSCLVLLHAPPTLCPYFIVPYSGPAHSASQLLCLCCPPSPCLSCASLRVLPCGARVTMLSLCSCGLAVSLGFCAPRCACAGLGVSRVVCPPLLWFLSLSFLPPLPREWSICALVQLAPRCAGASLWVSGCSCDGSVALLSCWECG